MNWFELSVKSRANESVPVSLPTIYLYGLPNSQIVKLQRVQNAAARLVLS